MQTIHVGFDNYVILSRIVAVMAPNTEPAKRLRERAEERDMLLDLKKGRKCRSIIVTDSNHVILSANLPEILRQRVEL